MPIVLGVVAAILLKTFPYPGFTPTAAGIIQRGDRIIFGLVAGTFSTLMYRTIKALFYQKIVGFAQNWAGGTNTTVNIGVPTEQIPQEQLPSRGQV